MALKHARYLFDPIIAHTKQWRYLLTRPVVLACVLSLFSFSLAIAQINVDFSRFHQLIESTFGAERVAVSKDWESLLRTLKDEDELEKLMQINRFFHINLNYRLDNELWNQEDYWATPLETLGKGLGDCEDYAIAKYVSLRQSGISDQKLRLIYVRARIGGSRSSLTEAHMVLGYYATPTAEPLILDSLMPDVMPASERTDLSPVFSFNSQGLWAGNTKAAQSPTARLSRWRSVLERIEQQGINLQ